MSEISKVLSYSNQSKTRDFKKIKQAILLLDEILGNETSSKSDLSELRDELTKLVTDECGRAKASEKLNKDAIDILNGDSSIDGSVRKYISDLIGGAPEAYDTLKEIADYINNDETVDAALTKSLSDNKIKIDKVSSDLDSTKTELTELINSSKTEALNASKANTDSINKINNDLTTFAKTTDLADYATHEDLSAIKVPDVSNLVSNDSLTTTLALYAKKSELPAVPDLTPYVTKENLTTELDSYAKKTEITTPDLTPYVTKENLTTELGEYAKKTELPTVPDLTTYVTKDSLTTELGNYSKKTDLTQYVTSDSLTSTLATYAKKSDIVTPDLTPYVTKDNLTTELGNYAKKTEVTTPDLTSYVTKDNLTTELSTYAKKSELPTVPDLTSYVTSDSLTLTLATYAKKTDIPKDEIYIISYNPLAGNIVSGSYTEAEEAIKAGKVVLLKLVDNGDEVTTNNVLLASVDGDSLCFYGVTDSKSNTKQLTINKITLSKDGNIDDESITFGSSEETNLQVNVSGAECTVDFSNIDTNKLYAVIDNSKNSTDITTINFTKQDSDGNEVSVSPVTIKWSDAKLTTVKANTTTIVKFDVIDNVIYCTDIKSYTA